VPLSASLPVKVPLSEDVARTVGAAGRALKAVLETRRVRIEADMLNSAGSVSAEWYTERVWHYLWKQELLDGVSGFDVTFHYPARLADTWLYHVLPHPDVTDLVMDFEVLRKTAGTKEFEHVPVAHIVIHRNKWRRRRGVAPEAPYHPYGIEVRQRHLNSIGAVSWYTLVSVIMDVARRGAQFNDPRADRFDATLLYVVPAFSFTPLADAKAEPNLFIYPELSVDQGWTKGKTSAVMRVVYWAVANDYPKPIAESTVTVVRTSVVDGTRRPVDENGKAVSKPASAARTPSP
jgi:hypothetical protein